MQISRRRLLVVASTASFVGFSGFSLKALAAELTLPSVGADKKFSAVPVPADPSVLPFWNIPSSKTFRYSASATASKRPFRPVICLGSQRFLQTASSSKALKA